jgi:hypothetical protein
MGFILLMIREKNKQVTQAIIVTAKYLTDAFAVHCFNNNDMLIKIGE